MSQTTPRFSGAGGFTLGLAAVFALSMQHVSSAKTITVKSGTSIQAAIDMAPEGATILVNPGTYPEQLTIKKNFIKLIGTNAIIKPGGAAVSNACSSLTSPTTQAGICVQGDGLTFAQFADDHSKVTAVDTPIKNVTISGFTVGGFSGEGIAIVGATNTVITGNKLVDGIKFGLISTGSTNTKATLNIISSSTLRAVGMDMDDAAGSTFSNNNITNYATAVHVQSSAGRVDSNTIKSCCMGVLVDPTIRGTIVSTNFIDTINPACAQGDNANKPAGGIYINGASKSVVAANVVNGLHRSGNAAGIAIVDDKTSPAMAVASGNSFTLNVLTNNDVTFNKDTQGTGNTYTLNF